MTEKNPEVTPEEKSASEILPFTPDGVDEIFRLSGGNIRSFLQTCNDAYAKLLRDEEINIIDTLIVQKVVSEKVDLISRESVSTEIRGVLQLKKLIFFEEVKLRDDFVADFVIGAKENPIAVIEISEALFHLDEAEKALRTLMWRENLAESYPNTRFILVPMGYVSMEVVEYLDKVVDRTIIYDPGRFREEFEGLIDFVITEAGRPIPVAVDQELRAEIQGLKDSLSELIGARQIETSKLEASLKELFEAQFRQQDEAIVLRQPEWRSWLRQDQERWEQREVELKQKKEDERRRLQEDGERQRWHQGLLLRSIALISISLGTGFVVKVLPRIIFPYRDLMYRLSGEISLAVGFLTAVFLYFRFIHRWVFPLGPQTNEVAKFLGELGQLALRAKTVFIPPRLVKKSLKNPNPIIRYFAAQLFLMRREIPIHDIEWITMATSETWLPLYLLYLELATVNGDLKKLDEHLRLLIEANPEDPRIIHAISMLAQFAHHQELEELEIDGLFRARNSRYGKVLAHGIFEGIIGPRSLSVLRDEHTHPLVEFASEYRGVSIFTRMAPLVELFRERGQFWDDDAEGPLSLKLDEDELRLIIDTLSPHRENGLASFQELSISNLYLRLYRFFSEIQWRLDRGNIKLAP